MSFIPISITIYSSYSSMHKSNFNLSNSIKSVNYKFNLSAKKSIIKIKSSNYNKKLLEK
jgi:hypothetical protein